MGTIGSRVASYSLRSNAEEEEKNHNEAKVSRQKKHHTDINKTKMATLQWNSFKAQKEKNTSKLHKHSIFTQNTKDM